MVEICRDLNILSAKAREAQKKDSTIARKLEKTLKQYNEEVESGVHNGPYCNGMAADMIGEDAAVICIIQHDGSILTMMNPVLVKGENQIDFKEGCLCHEGGRPTRRYLNIVVEYRTPRWVLKRKKLSGVPAVAVQHEMDHLQGILV